MEQTLKISKENFYNKVLGCWMGKNIGGTLGAPFEWKRQVNDVKFYTHDLNGEPLPNDDLDLQLINLRCLEEIGPKMTSIDLANYWIRWQQADYSEYGQAKRNMEMGFMPPLSGLVNNEYYKDSCGAYIRSELWACIFPGRPDLAVRYAYEDAIIDHGDGEGTYAEFFSAAMESAAFVESDFNKLIEIGLSFIPEDCGVAKAVATAKECYEKKMTWLECRDTILERHRGYWGDDHCCFTCSDRDKELGFNTGRKGYDVASNIGILVAGMLYGEGDFEKTMCITVNMGEDADCTAGTVGAIFGIIYGYTNIPQKWVEPIGHGIKTICVAQAHGRFKFPATVENLTERVIRQAQIMSWFYENSIQYSMMEFTDGEEDFTGYDLMKLNKEIEDPEVTLSLKGPRVRGTFFSAALEYEDYVMKFNEPVKLKVKVTPTEWDTHFNYSIRILSDDFISSPEDVMVQSWPIRINMREIEFTLDAIEPKDIYRGVVEVYNNLHESIYLPIIFTSYKREELEDY